VNSCTAGIINATTPTWTIVLALTLRHQKSVSPWQAAGVIVGFGGALLIFAPWEAKSGVASAGGLGMPGSFGQLRDQLHLHGPVPSPARDEPHHAIGVPAPRGGSHARTRPGHHRCPAPHVTAVSVTGVVILGVIGTGIAYVLNYQIITSEGATIASTVTYLLPVVAIVLGVLVLGESVTITALAGIALVLAGVALTRHHAQVANPAEP
jgi:drug/metabolite transporter (DMT)-like permease